MVVEDRRREGSLVYIYGLLKLIVNTDVLRNSDMTRYAVRMWLAHDY